MSPDNILWQEIVQKLGWTLLHFVWQAAAVAFVLAIVLAVLRRSTANLRYTIACLALGLMVLLPVVTILMIPVSRPQPMVNVEPPPAPVIVPAPPTSEATTSAEVVEYEEPVQPEKIETAPTILWTQRAAVTLEPALPYLVTGWLLGVFGLSVWHLGGWAQLQRLRRKLTRPIDASLGAAIKQLAERLGVGRAVELLESALVQVPTVVGWLRPVILLPASALMGLSAEQLEALLAHELAHIRRYDYLVNMLQTVVETLGFYHPAVWWVSHKIRIERENCCDDLAVGITGDRLRYARALTVMEEIRANRSELAVAATGGCLFGRIRRLVNKESTDGSRAGWIPFVITILLIAIISVPTTIALTTKSPEPRQETPAKGNVKPESEEWENIGEIIPHDFNDTKVLTEHINLGSIGQDCEGKVFITCILDSAQSNIRRHRFVLVQKSGTILEPSGYTTFGSENKSQEKFSFNVPFRRQDIEGFRFQIRPLPLTGIDNSLLQLQQVNSAAVEQGKPVPSKLAPPGRYAIELDGIDDYLLVPDSSSLRLETPFTVEMWIKTNLPTDPNKEYWDWAVISKGFYVGTPRARLTGFGIVLNRHLPEDPSQLLIEYSTANNSGLFTMPYGTESKLENGKSDWIHISHVFNGENYKSAPGQPLVIGKFLIPTTRPLMGLIGEIRIWNGARTREQIRRYENVALTGNEPDLAAWWPFEQKEGQFAYDMSGNNNHARLGSSSGADDADPKWIDLEAIPQQAEKKIDSKVEENDQQLNDILKEFPDGTTADKSGSVSKSVRESVENYVAAALAGEDEKAAEYAYPDTAVAAQTKDMREISKDQDINIIATCIGEWNALAISSVIHADHGRTGPLVFLLKKVVLDQKVHWLIDDIDLETLDTIEPAIKRFIERNPDAKTIVVKTNVQNPGPSASKQPDSAAEDEPTEWRKQAYTGADSNDAMFENEMGQTGEVGLGTVQKAKLITLDPNTKRLEREFGFERLLHKAGDIWELEKPYMNVYRPNFTCYISADKGQVEVETAAGGMTPQDMTFSSNVVIRMVADGAGSVQESFLYLDNIVFLKDQSRFTTTGPARFVSENARMRGTGLELIYNDQAERLEYFEIADLESLHIKRTQAAATSTGTPPAETDAKRKAEVFGRVLQDGRNVVGARVIARICRDQLSTLSSRPPELVTRIGENGLYRFAHLPAGRYSIAVMSQKGNLNIAQKQINLEPGDKTELNFGDEEGFTLSGLVTVDGEAVEIASVRIQLPNESIKWGWTDHNGNFRITGIPRGRHQLFTMYDKDLDPVTFLWGKDGKQEYDTLFDRRQITLENDRSVDIHLEDRSKTGNPTVTRMPAAAAARIVKVELSVVEVSADSKMDSKTAAEIRNLLGGKITLPDSSAVADLFRKASQATAPVKDESAGEKRVTKEQFNRLFDLLVSRGYVKILLRPTLEVVEGQKAQIKIDQSSLEVTINTVKDDTIDMQLQADISSRLAPDGNDQTPMFSKRSFSSRVHINSGQSIIIGGLIQPAVRTDSAGDGESSQLPAKELLCIVTASITTPPADAKQVAQRDDFQVFKPRIIHLQNSDPVQMTKLLTALFAEEGAAGVNIRDVVLGEDAREKPDIAGPLSSHFTFEDVPGTSRIIVISNIPDAYEAVEQLVLELDKQKMGTKDVKQVRECIAGLSRFARQVKESEARLMCIGKALLAYAQDHDGKYPAKLKLYELQEYLKTEEYAWPRQYEYLAEGRTTRDPEDTVIYYDAQLFEQGKGTNVLFNDGHVEFVGPKRLDELNINKTQILIETHILVATDDFLKENRLDANSVRTREIRSAYSIAESAAEPNSLPYCLVLDDLDVNQLLEATVRAQGKCTTIVAAPRVLTLDGRRTAVSIITDRLPVPEPSDPNNPSDKAESKPQYVEVGTSIKIMADVLPDSNNVLLDCEWELSQVRGFEERIGPDGKKQKVPIIAFDNIKATATVPDGKTLLIGGKKMRRYVLTTTKKPLLGDLPLVGSLFRSQSRVEEARNILILVKPTINPKKQAEIQAASKPKPPPPLDPNDPLIRKLERRLHLLDTE